MPRRAGFRRIGNKGKRISAARIFSQRIIIKIKLAGDRIHDNIFEHRAEALGGGKNFRLGFFRQIDHFGVTAAFKIEHAIFRPAMLIIADQFAIGVGRQCGFAGARQAEENRAIAIRPDIDRTMHRHDALGRQSIIEHGKHRFLGLTGIRCAANQNHFLVKIDRNHGLGAAAVARRIGFETGEIQNHKLWFKTFQFIFLRLDEQVLDEQGMPSQLGDHAGCEAVGLIGPAEQILHQQLPAFGIGQHVFMQRLELLTAYGFIIVPPNIVFRGRVANDEFILRRAPRMGPCFDQKRAAGCNFALAARQRQFVNFRRT